MSNEPRLGIFIPTIGSRPEYLPEEVQSVNGSLPSDREVQFFVLIEQGFLKNIE